MADFVYNIAKGRVVELANRVLNNDPTNSALVVLLLKGAAADTTLKDLDTLSAVLGDVSTTEADASGYSRKTITDAAGGLTVTVDDTNDLVDVDVSDIAWGTLGAGNNLTDVIFAYDNDTAAGTDANIVPLTQHDFVLTTQGTEVTTIVNNFFRAT